MAKTVRESSNVFNKGGVFYLLYFFFILNPGKAQEIIYDGQLESSSYGKISLQGLNHSIIKQIEEEDFTDKQWSTFFRTSVEGSTRPMLGTYSTGHSKMSFKPRFLPDPEISYVITFSSKALNKFFPEYPVKKDLSTTIRFNVISDKLNKVTNVFPESDFLPANVLRFYIHFSKPADFQNPFDYVHIENEKGERIKEPFVEMEEGLWSLDRKRLTVLIHPGRIKRNVGPNVTMGEVFKESESYRLVVSDKWNLKEKFIKSFKITEALRTRIDIENWKIETPRPGSRDDLVIKTGRPLDKALSERLITLLDKNGNTINGSFNYSDTKSQLMFTPEPKWDASSYSVDVNPKLEDVCGNTPQNAFDIEGEGEKAKPGKYEIRFIVKR